MPYWLSGPLTEKQNVTFNDGFNGEYEKQQQQQQQQQKNNNKGLTGWSRTRSTALKRSVIILLGGPKPVLRDPNTHPRSWCGSYTLRWYRAISDNGLKP